MSATVLENAEPEARRWSDATVVETLEPWKIVIEQFELDDRDSDNDSIADSTEIAVQHPKGAKLMAISVALTIVLVALGFDIAVVAVTVPALSDQFHSIQDIGWYSTALRLVMCSFMFLFGKAYTLFSVKYLFMLSLAIFETGNILCTFAQSSAMFIIGRAICGLGCSGLSGGLFTIIAYAFPLHQRALVGGIAGAIETLASMAAPLIGGALITSWTWRACFGINIPLGIIGCGVMFFFLELTPNPAEKLPLKQKLKKLDLTGTAIFVPAVVCLLLALQWGGSVYAWDNVRTIALLVLFVILFSIFMLIEWKAGESASIPFRILRNRSLLGGAFFAMCLNAIMAIIEYYMSIYFQGIRGYTAFKTGVFALPMIAGLCIASPLSGAFTTWIGYYYPSMYVATVFASVAVGVLTIIEVDTSLIVILSMLAVLGLAVGAGIQAPQVAAQTVLDVKEVSIGISIVQFGSQMGPVLFLAGSAALFTNQLRNEIHIHSPSTNVTALDGVGLTDIRNHVDPANLQDVLTGFNAAVVKTMYLPLVLACISIFGAISMERISVKKDKKHEQKLEMQKEPLLKP